jgi:aspartate/tyrosine/aromatic aminotransferase
MILRNKACKYAVYRSGRPSQVGGEFLARFYPGPKTVLIPTPSWANHKGIFERCGMEVKQYR